MTSPVSFGFSPSFRSGEPSRRCSMALTAACSSEKSSSLLDLPLDYSSSSSLEFCVESGGEMTAPVGIRLLFTGGGDCLKLPD